jgi:hypothetical protein
MVILIEKHLKVGKFGQGKDPKLTLSINPNNNVILKYLDIAATDSAVSQTVKSAILPLSHIQSQNKK